MPKTHIFARATAQVHETARQCGRSARTGYGSFLDYTVVRETCVTVNVPAGPFKKGQLCADAGVQSRSRFGVVLVR